MSASKYVCCKTHFPLTYLLTDSHIWILGSIILPVIQDWITWITLFFSFSTSAKTYILNSSFTFHLHNHCLSLYNSCTDTQCNLVAQHSAKCWMLPYRHVSSPCGSCKKYLFLTLTFVQDFIVKLYIFQDAM